MDVNATDYSGGNAITALLSHTLDQSEDVPILQALIKAGADVNARGSEYQQTPIFLVDNSPHSITILRLLKAAGANVNATDEFGRTPLMTCFDVDYAKALDLNP